MPAYTSSITFELPTEEVELLLEEADRRKITLSDLIRERLGLGKIDGDNVGQFPIIGT